MFVEGEAAMSLYDRARAHSRAIACFPYYVASLSQAVTIDNEWYYVGEPTYRGHQHYGDGF